MAGAENPQDVDLGPDSYGGGLAVSTIVVFLIPLCAGIAGAALAGRAWDVSAGMPVSGYQGLGLLAGSAVGIVAARGLIAWRLYRRRKSCSVGDHS